MKMSLLGLRMRKRRLFCGSSLDNGWTAGFWRFNEMIQFNTNYIAYWQLIYYKDKCLNFNSFKHFSSKLSADSISPLFAFLSICRKKLPSIHNEKLPVPLQKCEKQKNKLSWETKGIVRTKSRYSSISYALSTFSFTNEYNFQLLLLFYFNYLSSVSLEIFLLTKIAR